jgi:hypothetical protein
MSSHASSKAVRNLYADDADAEGNDLIRVIDESGEDYLYFAFSFCLFLDMRYWLN